MIKQYQLCKRQNNFEITLNYKGVKVKVCFTGGNTYKGILPTCYEKDLFKQRAIEASQMFKDREIVLKRTIAEAGDGRQPVAVQTKKVKVAPRTTVKMLVKPSAPKPSDPKPEIQTQEPPQEQEQEPKDVVLDEPKSKEFANLGEAILYIAQQWQVEAKTEAEARKILKEHGINPKIKKG